LKVAPCGHLQKNVMAMAGGFFGRCMHTNVIESAGDGGEKKGHFVCWLSFGLWGINLVLLVGENHRVTRNTNRRARINPAFGRVFCNWCITVNKSKNQAIQFFGVVISWSLKMN